MNGNEKLAVLTALKKLVNLDLAANVSYTLGRAQILSDAGEEES